MSTITLLAQASFQDFIHLAKKQINLDHLQKKYYREQFILPYKSEIPCAGKKLWINKINGKKYVTIPIEKPYKLELMFPCSNIEDFDVAKFGNIKFQNPSVSEDVTPWYWSYIPDFILIPMIFLTSPGEPVIRSQKRDQLD